VTLVSPELSPLHDVASRFFPAEQSAVIREYGSGNINKTYLVAPDGGRGEPVLLQRINTHVFPSPELVMGNIRAVSRHLALKSAPLHRWEVPHVLLTHEGADHWQAGDGSYWRALRFIQRSRTVDVVRDAGLAREVGHALGTFHALVGDLPAEDLADTLPGFHVAPGYLAGYDRVAGTPTHTAEEGWCTAFIARNRHWVPVLERAREEGHLRLRPIHGDPKVNNILFDDETGRAIAMIDWDTIKPGLVQYDIGDCLRSSCNPDGEETANWRDVRFDLDLGRAVLEGYLSVARGFFDDADFDYIPDAARLIAFELGLRFFTDHLQGDVYFNVARRGQNLARALVQFRLAESIDESFDELTRTVRALR
jgi:Ser/Thr protein kinase RdoA (MazF antagonist)